MPHVRTQIRAALVSALMNNTAAGVNVFDSREQAIAATELPALVVRTGREQDAALTMPAPASVLDRALELTITAHIIKKDGTHAAALDALMAEVEIVVASNVGAGGAKSITPTDSNTEFDAESEGVRGEGVVAFQCVYQTSQINPNTNR